MTAHANAQTLAEPSALPRPQRRPSALERFALRRVHGSAARWRHAALTLRLPDGSELAAGSIAGKRIAVTVRDWSFFLRVLLDADIGAGESYARGDWDCDDLTALVSALLEAREASRTTTWLAWVSAAKHATLRAKRAHRPDSAARNVRAHYDLGNDFFALFLDPSMTYSSAVYPDGDATLEAAQQHKIDLVCRSLALRPGMHVLDVGCGWGALALHAATRYGCRVTAVTLSPAQASWTRTRVREAGLEDRIDVRIADYGEVTGTFDAISSIEMLEAVGYRGYDRFFGYAAGHLAAAGRLFVQVIAFPHSDYTRYRLQYDFVRKHIFPAGLLPSPAALSRAIAPQPLRVDWTRDIGTHYARTLRDWRLRLTTGGAQATAVPRSRLRAWEFYMAICEAGFASGHLSVIQTLLTRFGNQGVARDRAMRAS